MGFGTCRRSKINSTVAQGQSIMTIGTNGNDTLASAAAGDVLLGLDGVDNLTSTHLDTALFGDAGADILDSQGLFVIGGVAGDTETNTIVQNGGDGGDDLFADVKVDTTGGLDNVFNGIFNGGGADDVIDATISGTATGGATGNVDVSSQAFGGNGADNVTATAASGAITNGTALARASGGKGFDTVRAEVQDSGFTQTGFSHAIADGGSANDIVSTSIGLLGGASGGTTEGLADLTGGFGLDTLDAFTFANSTFGENSNVISTHNLDGGGANDDITSNMISNGSAETIDYAANIIGGLGRDTVDNDIGANAVGDSSATADIDGGGGQDNINSLVTALSSTGTATIAVNIDGGLDIDTIYSGVQITQGDAASTAINNIDGGNGNDTITAEIFAASPAAEARGQNIVEGGAGSDVITVIGGGDTQANRNQITGGNGNDTITGADGAADLINGGIGSDLIIASTNTNKNGDVLQDFLIGGGGIDTFQFDYAADQDVQVFQAWDGFNNDLQMVGLVDTNANSSLVDEFDAASTIIDNGAGNNVDVIMASGTLLIFAGQGTGSVSSIADLLTFDADTQLFG